MKSMLCKLGLALAVGFVSATATQAAVFQYTDWTSFTAASGALTTENFDTYSGTVDLAPSTSLGPFSVATNGVAQLRPGGDPYNVNGTEFLLADISGTTAAPGTLTFNFAAPILSFGADFFSLNNNVTRTYATVGGVTFDPLPNSPSFLGFVSTVPFSSLTFSNPMNGPNNDRFGVDNVTFSSSVPVPGTLALFGLAAVAGVAASRRRKQ